MKKIPLTKNQLALVDDEDFKILAKYSWCATKRGNTYYAERGSKKNGKCISYKMHRVIMNAPAEMQVDHINGNGLDNRKSNLRLVTARENSQNRHEKTTSSYPGVYFHSENSNWIAQISVNCKTIHLGSFDSEEKAKLCYEDACQKLEQGEDVKPKRTATTSKYRGVYWKKAESKWFARIQSNGKRISIGLFFNEQNAAIAYDQMAIKLHGKSARLNFPEKKASA